MATIQTSLPTTTPDDASIGSAPVLDQLSDWNVLIPDRTDVVRYLTRFPGTESVLPRMSAEARRVFGADVELSLEVYHDREIVDEWLGLFVRKEIYPRGFLDQIDAINRKFDDELEQTTGYLQLATDYCRPRGMNAV